MQIVSFQYFNNPYDWRDEWHSIIVKGNYKEGDILWPDHPRLRAVVLKVTKV